jgi:hypothetical protein
MMPLPNRVQPDGRAQAGLEHNVTPSEWLDSSSSDVLLSKFVLDQDWDTPEEDDAWAYLSHFLEVGVLPGGGDLLPHLVRCGLIRGLIFQRYSRSCKTPSMLAPVLLCRPPLRHFEHPARL